MWQNVKCIPSSDTNVRKYVFTNEGEHGAVAEAVLYKYPTYEERTVGGDKRMEERRRMGRYPN